jgi:hypothetical protein
MSEAIDEFARVRDRVAAANEEPMDPADPWVSVLRLFDVIFERLDADNSRFTALEARRAAAHGRDGADAVGIISASINNVGHLVLEFSDGVLRDVGRVVGSDAPPAPAPKSLEFVRDDTGRIVSSILR